MTGNHRRRPSRIHIALLAVALLLQSLVTVLPAAAATSMQHRADARAAVVSAPCDIDNTAGQPAMPCCDDDAKQPPCGDPGQCGGDCGLLRAAALLSASLFDPPALLHEAQVPAARLFGLRPRHTAPGLRPPISA